MENTVAVGYLRDVITIYAESTSYLHSVTS